MKVRPARKREEVWLLDHLEAFGMEDPAFRSRDYVIAEDDAGEKVGFGRLRVHTGDDHSVCELTNIGVVEEHRGDGVGAGIVQQLVENAADQGFEAVYSMTPSPEYLALFGFDPVDEDALPERMRERLAEQRSVLDEDVTPMILDVEEFSVPLRLRRDEAAEQVQETAEDFGIDPENTTYKYDTGR